REICARVSLRERPLLAVSSKYISSRCASNTSASLLINLARVRLDMPAHSGLSNAARALRTAWSTSSSLAWLICASNSPVAGLITSSIPVPVAGTSRPSMKRPCSDGSLLLLAMTIPLKKGSARASFWIVCDITAAGECRYIPRMNFWFIQSLNSLALGGVLFILAAGFSLIFGLMRIANLSHGAYFMFGAYIGLTVLERGYGFGAAVLAAGVGVGILGGIVERVVLRRLAGNTLSQVLATLGVAFVIADASLWIWGGDPRPVSAPAFLAGGVQLF